MIDSGFNTFDIAMRRRVRALSMNASQYRRNGFSPVDWMLSWYEPDSIPREDALDEQNVIMGNVAGWCWGPPKRREWS